ncbi:hypothetical protein [Haloarchaeobius amylolyticus]|uniref:hypothetical protein n=1 Tax=Haloarchaeobius amylolyticus TaxID=1198296 RepID=UPI00226DABBD|nr:hypothetical protein [Haloarchaeobius amylolyticus]
MARDTDDTQTAETLTTAYDWPEDHPREDVEHVGILEKGTNVFYESGTSMFFHTELDEEREEHTFVEGSERELQPQETLADAIESIGETTGWDSLSEWAEEHLESDDEES